MVRIAWVLAFLVVLAGCSDPEPAPPVDLGTPEQRVTEWLVALDQLELGGLDGSTDPVTVALMVGAENELTEAQMFAVIDSGLPGPTAQSYWSSFRSSFETFLGADVAEITVGEVERFRVGDDEFAAVTINQGEASTQLVTVLTDAGWRVDLVGSAGSSLAAQLTQLVSAIVEGADGEEAEAAARYRTAAIASLRAALELHSGDRALQLEIDAIESLPRPTA